MQAKHLQPYTLYIITPQGQMIQKYQRLTYEYFINQAKKCCYKIYTSGMSQSSSHAHMSCLQLQSWWNPENELSKAWNKLLYN